MNSHGSLIIVCGRENLRLLGWDSRVLLDQRARNTAHGFDTKRKWCDIEKQNVSDVTRQYCRLNCRANRYRFVWVHVSAWLFSEELCDAFLHERHAGLATNENDIVDTTDLKIGIREGKLQWLERTLD